MKRIHHLSSFHKTTWASPLHTLQKISSVTKHKNWEGKGKREDLGLLGSCLMSVQSEFTLRNSVMNE